MKDIFAEQKQDKNQQMLPKAVNCRLKKRMDLILAYRAIQIVQVSKDIQISQRVHSQAEQLALKK